MFTKECATILDTTLIQTTYPPLANTQSTVKSLAMNDTALFLTSHLCKACLVGHGVVVTLSTLVQPC